MEWLSDHHNYLQTLDMTVWINKDTGFNVSSNNVTSIVKIYTNKFSLKEIKQSLYAITLIILNFTHKSWGVVVFNSFSISKRLQDWIGL